VTDIAAGNAMASTTVPSTNIASGSAIVIDALGPTARLISCSTVSCVQVNPDESVEVQSSETGTAYLVKIAGSGTNVENITHPDNITNADVDLWNSVTIIEANADRTIALTDLEEGIYKVYAVDALGNLSTASVGTGGRDTSSPLDGVVDLAGSMEVKW